MFMIEMLMAMNEVGLQIFHAYRWCFLSFCKASIFVYFTFILQYGGGAGNTVEENSSIFSLIRMH